MPWPLPGSPLVRAKTRLCEAVWMPVFQVFSPLITQSSPPASPSPFTRTARVSMKVASLPWAGSVMPKAKPLFPAARSSTHSFFCSGLP